MDKAHCLAKRKADRTINERIEGADIAGKKGVWPGMSLSASTPEETGIKKPMPYRKQGKEM